MIGFFGLLSGLALLIWLALRGANILLASILCSVLVMATNALPFSETLYQSYTFGDLGAFTFAGRFFFLFVAGAAFGRVMGESHAATSIAMAMVRWLGAECALWITVISCALLTYGGVVVFVVIFAMYPLGLRLLKEADIPKRLFCGALALGAGTFTLTALPGTPSIQNVIPSVVLGTDLFAGAWLGLVSGTIMFTLGMWYLETERVRAKARGEGFTPGPRDNMPDLEQIKHEQPHWAISIAPLCLVIGAILTPRLMTLAGIGHDSELIAFAKAQPVLWPSIALFTGSLLALVLFRAARKKPLQLLGDGVQDAINPLMATAAVIGFGGVVVQTAAFSAFTSAIENMNAPPLISMVAGVSVVSGITGSSSGGLQIFMSTMADPYLAMGIDRQELHRIAAMTSGGFDSLPHCGAVIATLAITQLSHREAYKDIGIVTVLIPVVAALCAVVLAMLT